MKLDNTILPLLYMLAAHGIHPGIKWMSSPATARRGVIMGEIGMLLAVVGTLLRFEVVSYEWISWPSSLGTAVGIPDRLHHAHDRCSAANRVLARVRRAGFGADRNRGILQGHQPRARADYPEMTALIIETLLGFLTFTASMMAFGKLQEILPPAADHV